MKIIVEHSAILKPVFNFKNLDHSEPMYISNIPQKKIKQIRFLDDWLETKRKIHERT